MTTSQLPRPAPRYHVPRTIGAGSLTAVIVLLLAAPASAERVTEEEAQTVATAWVSLVTRVRGDWAGSVAAFVERLEALQHGGRQVGWAATIHPTGYVVVPAFKELAPVKAYSTTARLDLTREEGMADLIKGRMATMVQRLEERADSRDLSTENLATHLGSDYATAWRELGLVPAGESPSASAMAVAAWAGGQVMLATAWHQREPYNRDCPQVFGSESCTSAVVGCIPLAAAQIMRYWSWPPYGTGFPFDDPYDWANMPETLDVTSPLAQIDAVAELNHEAGEAADVDYGCGETGGFLACWWAGCTSMQDAYRDTFRFASDTDDRDRDDEDSAADWFAWIKSEISQNRPLQYRIPGHNVVVDGWQEIGSAPLRQYHVNYGWGSEPDDNLGWYTVDEIPGGDPGEEYMLVHLRPATAVGPVLAGQYTLDPSFPYRYFDVDASGSAAGFAAGQTLQLLPGVTVAGTGSGGSSVIIASTAGAPTRLFASGDPSRGVVLRGATLWLAGGGSFGMLPIGSPRFLTASYESELQAVALRWELAYGDIDGHVVERKLGYDGVWETVGEAAAGARAYLDETVRRGFPYSYRVRSRGGARRSEWSRTVQITAGTVQ